MDKISVGNRVRLSERIAEWYLDHPEVYLTSAGRVASSFDSEVQLHMLACMNHPVTGIVMDVTNFTEFTSFYVEFKVGSIKAGYWVEGKDLEIYRG